MKSFPSLNKTIKYYHILVLLVFAGLLQSCTDTATTKVRMPATELYQKAMVAFEDEFYLEALKNFEILIEEHSGTRLATLSHLKMGDLYFLQNKWEEAESSYRRFLLLNPRTHLTPYTLNRLIALNYERNIYGLFVKSRDYDRNMEPNRTLIPNISVSICFFRKVLIWRTCRLTRAEPWVTLLNMSCTLQITILRKNLHVMLVQRHL